MACSPNRFLLKAEADDSSSGRAGLHSRQAQ